MGRKLGLDLDTMVSILRSSSGGIGCWKTISASRPWPGDFEPGFALDLLFKDLNLFLQTATEAQAPALIAASTLQLTTPRARPAAACGIRRWLPKRWRKLAQVELGTLTPDR